MSTVKDLIVTHVVKKEEENLSYKATQKAIFKHRVQQTYEEAKGRLCSKLKNILPPEVHKELQYYMVPAKNFYRGTRAGATFSVDGVVVYIQETLSTRPHDVLELEINNCLERCWPYGLWDDICKQIYPIIATAK